MDTATQRLRSEGVGGEASVSRAAGILRSGGTVAFPTETVYGLGANALDPAAVAKVFAAKERPRWDPLIVHIEGQEMLERMATFSTDSMRETVDLLTRTFWPGPLTLLLPRTPEVPDAVTAGRELVGVRWPAHPVARELIRAGRGTGGGSERKSFRPHEPNDCGSRSCGSGRTHRRGAGWRSDACGFGIDGAGCRDPAGLSPRCGDRGEAIGGAGRGGSTGAASG